MGTPEKMRFLYHHLNERQLEHMVKGETALTVSAAAEIPQAKKKK